MVKYVSPPEMLEWYKVTSLSTEFSGLTKTANSFPGVVLSLTILNLVTNVFLLMSLSLLQPCMVATYSTLNTDTHP